MPKLSTVLIGVIALLLVLAFVFLFFGNLLMTQIFGFLAIGVSFWAERVMRQE